MRIGCFRGAGRSPLAQSAASRPRPVRPAFCVLRSRA